MEMFVFIVYSALAYWAAGQTIYANKIQIGTMKNIFLNRLVVGILLGVIEIFGKAYISTQLADAIVFAVLIVVLLVKPTGLLGKKISEKV